MKLIGLFRNEGVAVPILPPHHRYGITYAIFDGESYFDTGWKPGEDGDIDKIEICWYVSEEGRPGKGDITKLKSLYGAGGGDPQIYLVWLAEEENNIKIRFSQSYDLPDISYSNTDFHVGDKIILLLEWSNNIAYSKLYINDILKYLNQKLANKLGASNTIWIGHTNPGVWDESTFIGNYCYAKFYQNNTLLHDYRFIEVSGVGKMKDEVTGTIFKNQGSGSIEIVKIY